MLDLSPSQKLQAICHEIGGFAKSYPLAVDEIVIEAVSKNQPISKILNLLSIGHRIFAENKVQEAQSHWGELKSEYPDVQLHLIGALQSNKVRDAVQIFDVIETVDSERITDLIAKEAKKINKKQYVMLQVNIGDEPQKSGVSISDLPALLNYVKAQDNLELIGLMCIPPASKPASIYFAKMLELKQQYELPSLSMGMSSDYMEAIRFGATHIRLGTAIFGERN
jgi:pyridoxal phosphate enzyme (YggS family)